MEVAIGFVKECGSMLQNLSPQGIQGKIRYRKNFPATLVLMIERAEEFTHEVNRYMPGMLQEGEIDKQLQFPIEKLSAISRANFHVIYDLHSCLFCTCCFI